MDSTITGVILILLIGVGLLAVAALADWRSKKRAEAVMAQAPDRGPAMAEAPTPTYVAQPAAGERPRRSPLTAEEHAAMDRDLDSDEKHVLAATLADARLATSSAPERAILRGPLVLVCPDGILSVREVLDTLNRAAEQKSGIVLAAPSFDPEVLDMLSVNVDRGTLEALPVTASPGVCLELARITGATGVPRSDLQAGYLPHSVYGRALLVMAGLEETVVVAPVL